MSATGGSAFPQTQNVILPERYTAQLIATGGMTLRDWFAGQLVAGLALNCGDGCRGYMEQRAKVAYEFADAMITEGAKTK